MYDESTFPKIISVDDHIMEPPNVWQDRLPEKYRSVGPRVVRQKVADMQFVGGVFSYREAGEHEEGTWCDWWYVEDLRYPLTRVMAAAGYPRDEVTISPITMEDMREGCWEQSARLADMDVDGVFAEVLFPPQRTMSHFLGDDDDDFVLAGVEAFHEIVVQLGTERPPAPGLASFRPETRSPSMRWASRPASEALPLL